LNRRANLPSSSSQQKAAKYANRHVLGDVNATENAYIVAAMRAYPMRLGT